MQDFDQPIAETLLNIVDKKRANLLTWRGQFSPQLIEVILSAYCLPNSIVLDPFSGSGTVLLEAGRANLEAYGCEINPAAWMLSQTYELINQTDRKILMDQIRKKIDQYFPFILFQTNEIEVLYLEKIIDQIKNELLDNKSKSILNTLITLIDVSESKITHEVIQHHFSKLATLIEQLPYSSKIIQSYLADARNLPFVDNQIDFVVTSPPYINVFNYHQNYRKSTELLGWDLLKIAPSEIGSNRANRGNRFYTVIQYCLDIAETLIELSRVTKKGARLIFIVGHQSQVLGIPFYQGDILEKLATASGLYQMVLRQKREYKNKFGKVIREDILNFYNLKISIDHSIIEQIARDIAYQILENSLSLVSSQNLECLQTALNQVKFIQGTPKLENISKFCKKLILENSNYDKIIPSSLCKINILS